MRATGASKRSGIPRAPPPPERVRTPRASPIRTAAPAAPKITQRLRLRPKGVLRFPYHVRKHMRQHLVSHWRVWPLVAVIVIAATKLLRLESTSTATFSSPSWPWSLGSSARSWWLAESRGEWLRPSSGERNGVGSPSSRSSARHICWMRFRLGLGSVWFCDGVLTLGGPSVTLTFCDALRRPGVGVVLSGRGGVCADRPVSSVLVLELGDDGEAGCRHQPAGFAPIVERLSGRPLRCRRRPPFAFPASDSGTDRPAAAVESTRWRGVQ
jgi:hypothetical protein